jgi:hypothetical protein
MLPVTCLHMTQSPKASPKEWKALLEGVDLVIIAYGGDGQGWHWSLLLVDGPFGSDSTKPPVIGHLDSSSKGHDTIGIAQVFGATINFARLQAGMAEVPYFPSVKLACPEQVSCSMSCGDCTVANTDWVGYLYTRTAWRPQPGFGTGRCRPSNTPKLSTTRIMYAYMGACAWQPF